MDYNYIYEEFNWPNIFDNPEYAAIFSVVIVIAIALAAFVAACTLTLYILRSIGLYKLAVNRGMSNPGLAWIPFVGMFRAGAIADDISERQGAKTYFRYLILGGSILSWIFSSSVSAAPLAAFFANGFNRYGRGRYMFSSLFNGSIGSISSLIGLAVFVITVMALNKIYKSYNPMSSTSWTVLSVIFPFLQSIFLFSLKNRMPVPEWNNQPQGYYPPPPPYNHQDGGYYPPRAPEPPTYTYPPQDMPPGGEKNNENP